MEVTRNAIEMKRHEDMVRYKFQLIKDGCEFGLYDIYGDVFMYELIRVVDEDNYIIEAYERSIDRTYATSADAFVVILNGKHIY